MLEYRKFITRAMVKAEPNTLFVFGDNLARRGFGGQAREMRGEPNAVGIPTKYRPSMDEDAFFIDTEECRREFSKATYTNYLRLTSHGYYGGHIVWPKDGIGTRLAELEKRAPKIYKMIKELEELLGRLAQESHVDCKSAALNAEQVQILSYLPRSPDNFNEEST